MKCSDCKFWLEQSHSANILGRAIPNDHKDASKIGECRANPPMPVRGDNTGWRMYPCTTAKDWCGDFEKKQEAVPVANIQQQPAPVEIKQQPAGIISDLKKRMGRPPKTT
jgi:hypothetical protein